MRPAPELVCANRKTTPTQGRKRAFREPLLGPATRKHAAHEPLRSMIILEEVPLTGLPLGGR